MTEYCPGRRKVDSFHFLNEYFKLSGKEEGQVGWIDGPHCCTISFSISPPTLREKAPGLVLSKSFTFNESRAHCWCWIIPCTKREEVFVWDLALICLCLQVLPNSLAQQLHALLARVLSGQASLRDLSDIAGTAFWTLGFIHFPDACKHHL